MPETALITGASSGLGWQYAKLFAKDKKDLALVARRRERLEALAAELSSAHGVKVHVLVEDLGDPAAASRISQEAQRRSLTIEYLVNNAGLGATGVFVQGDAPKQLEMVQVNVVALVALTRAFLPDMVRRGHGRILNIGSTAGFQPGPFMAVYYASKAFVNSFSEALAHELDGTGVTVTLSCPGATATEFAQVAGNAESRLFQMGAMGPREVALHAYRAMMKGDVIAVPGLKNKVGIQSLRFAPRAMVRSIAAKLNRS